MQQYVPNDHGEDDDQASNDSEKDEDASLQPQTSEVL